MTKSAATADQKASPPNIAQAVRLAFFLADATASDSDETIETAEEIASRVELFFAVAVVVGVAAEYLVPLFGYTALWSWPGAAVALGVAGEVIFGRRGSHLQGVITTRSKDRLSAAKREAGEAKERAAKAELELVKFRAWRRLDDAGFQHVAKVMAPFSGTQFTLALSIVEPETTELMWQICDALKAAGLDHQGWPQTDAIRFPAGENAVTPGIGSRVNVRDVTITWELEPMPPPLARAGQTLSTALNAVGIAAGAFGERQAPMTRPNPTLRVMIGRKT